MMRGLIVGICMLLGLSLTAQELSIVSWNIKDLGKSRNDKEIIMIAEQLSDADIVAIQEVVAKDPAGAKAVARIADELNRKGDKWDYKVSDPTGDLSPNKRERYAFLWKTKNITLRNRIALVKELDPVVCREPALACFSYKGADLYLLNYHACTHTSDYPERDEIAAITEWIRKTQNHNIIWCGDMNLVIDDQAFLPIWDMDFKSALNGQKTSLKKACKDGNYLSRAEDNIIYKLKDFTLSDAGVIDFIAKGDCNDVSWKRNSLSDHLGVRVGIFN